MRPFLVRLVLRWLDIPLRPQPNQLTEDFFAAAHGNDGFQRYLNAREKKLKDFIADTTTVKDNQKNLMALGQLQELRNIMSLAQRAYEAKLRKASDRLEKSPRA